MKRARRWSWPDDRDGRISSDRRKVHETESGSDEWAMGNDDTGMQRMDPGVVHSAWKS